MDDQGLDFDIDDLLGRLPNIEGGAFEAKLARTDIPKAAWETFSSFANTGGGVIVFGLEQRPDGWLPQGVKNPEKMVNDLAVALRNKQRISFDVTDGGSISEVRQGDIALVAVQIPPAPRTVRPVHLSGNPANAYLRKGESDARCTEQELARLLSESAPDAYDRTILPFLTLDDFNGETVARLREMMSANRPNLPHNRKQGKEFLEAIGAWRVNRELGKEGPTVAGILVLGNEGAIKQVRPGHVIDYQQFLIDDDVSGRWSDRVRWRKNLLDAWEAIFPRLLRGLPQPFRLSGPHRIDQPRGQVSLREAFVNLLVHADYSVESDSVIIHRADSYTFRNPGESRLDRRYFGSPGRSARRNNAIAEIFDYAGLADLAGSGFMIIWEEWKGLGYRLPEVASRSAEYEFELSLSLASLLSHEDRDWLASIGGPWKEEEELALICARHEGNVDNQRLRAQANTNVLSASTVLRSLRDRKYLTMEGSGRATWYRLGPAATSPQVTPRAVQGQIPVQPPLVVADPQHGRTDTQADLGDTQADLSDTQADLSELSDSENQVVADIVRQLRVHGNFDIAAIALCAVAPHSLREIIFQLGVPPGDHYRVRVRNLVRAGKLRLTLPDKPKSPQQRYVAVQETDDYYPASKG